jgi:hypothetical protein
MMDKLVKNIRGRNYLRICTKPDFLSARNVQRDVHGAFGKRISIPVEMSFNQVRKQSLADVRIRKDETGYGVFARPKNKLWFPHVVIMGRKER